jgi:hypothetical protein
MKIQTLEGVNKMTEYTYHQDPGHGWIEVSLAEVVRLRLNPSSYSYRKAESVYLEEDVDASHWAKAKRDAGEQFTLKDAHVNYDSFIRSLPRFGG